MRLFVAGDLPEPARAALHDHGAALVAAGGWRAVPVASLHLTLAFLGERPEDDVPPIADALASSVTPCGLVTLGEPLTLPPRRPRVAAVRLTDPSGGVGRLQAAVSAALAGLGVYRPEARPYLPHVTVARRRGRDVPGEPPAPDWSAVGPFAVPSVTLYRSRLSRAGAQYEALASVAVPVG